MSARRLMEKHVATVLPRGCPNEILVVMCFCCLLGCVAHIPEPANDPNNTDECSSCRRAGVEHLLRNVKDATISNLSTDVTAKLQALKGLKSRLLEIQEYLGLVLDGKLPINHDILNYLQVRARCELQLRLHAVGPHGRGRGKARGGVEQARAPDCSPQLSSDPRCLPASLLPTAPHRRFSTCCPT